MNERHEHSSLNGNGTGADRAGAEGDSPSTSKWSAKKVFTTGEAAELCKVSQQTIIRCFDSGRLSGFRVPGSRFRRIPRDELIRFMRANEIPTRILEDGGNRVLVVDDDPDILELFTDALARREGWEVRTAATGYEAGMLTESFRPQLIVLDYMLPDVNGNIVCERVRQHPEMVDTKIIFISGVIERDEVERLLAAGADDFVQKPFDVHKLIGKMEELAGS